ncbi:hypothetical protein HYQ45_016283 [Verticillium longisporum]|uniref:Peroxin 11C n=1 Tax=Verticillium longisporum TaxID=100787 RepID=A0A8I3AI89_VERLO|nr:hypothetical protein HYQ45_016283 [Verticillium longisporum]
MTEANAITDLPSGEPIALPTPAPAPPKLPLSAILAATPSNIDAFIAHLHRCMQTPSGIDTVLLFIGYTARLSSNLLDAASRSALHRSAHKLITLAFSLPESTTLLLSAAPQASPVATLALRLATRLRALSLLLSESRVFLRSWGLLGIYFAGRRLVLPLVEKKTKPQAVDEKTGAKPDTSAETLDKTIAWAQFITLVLFQSLENAYFLGGKGVFGLTPAQQVKAARWSTRSWSAYVGLEIGRLLIERQRRKTGDATSAEHKEWKAAWQRSFVRNVAWAPLTVHWSTADGFLNDTVVWAIGCVPGVVQMRQLWKDTA